MKVGLVVPGFSADADDWCIPALRNLVAALAQEDEVVVLALRYPYRAGCYEVFGARVIALGGEQRRGLGSAALWRQAYMALQDEQRRGRFGVLHAFWATEAGFVTTLVGRRLGIPAVVSLAGGELTALRDIGYGDQLAASQRLIVGRALRRADAVTAGSQYLLDQAAPWLGKRPPGQVRRIPLGVDTTLFHPGERVATPAPPNLVHAASLVPVKDQKSLLRAIALLHRRGLPATLSIAGTGPLEPTLRALATGLGIAPAVTFLGAVPHDQLPDLYRRGTVFVLTSRHEAQGMAPLEAAACGLPVIGTRVGIIPALVPDAGIAVPVGDADALAGVLATMLGDEARLVAMGQAACALAADEYRLATSVRRFRDLYGTLTTGRMP
jgi:glycosyltransferase involved in cell wall biosynthesis